jgi:hypothetical protein
MGGSPLEEEGRMPDERALALLLLCSACTLDSISRTSDDMPPTGLVIDDSGTPAQLDFASTDQATPPGADLAILPDLAVADLAQPPMPIRAAVLTQHNDNQRTGANLREIQLTPANVNSNRFGKLFVRSVDGYLYAQPLVVPELEIAGKLRNVVFLATEHNSVYAFDADDPKETSPLWQVNLGTPVSSSEYSCLDLIPEDGITSTPVIDLASKTIYVSAKHKENGVYAQTLHALDLTTGIDLLPPVDAGGSVPGSGWGSPDGLNVPFNAKVQLQRPALLLSGGQIYLSFGSHCDQGGYHGWLMAYDAKTLQQTAIWTTTPNGGQGSLWMSGQGPSADSAGNVYAVTANGDTNIDGTQLSEAFVKLSPSLNVLDWFIPSDYQMLNDLDLDLGSDGILLVPNSNLAISGGKEGVLYVVDRTNLGHYQNGSDSQIVQSFKISQENVHGTPIYFDDGSQEWIYVWPEQTPLMAFRFQGNALDPNPSSQSPYSAPTGMPGGFLSLSANGTQGGIVWATLPLDKNANNATVTGIVRAFDATDVSKELWNSEQNPARDSAGNFAKFNPPTVVNGRLYVATFSNQLVVYGLLP